MGEQKPVVFIIDDEPEIRIMLETLMRSVDLTSQSFDDARVFLESASPDSQGCVISDIRMPGFTGIRLQQELRARKLDLPLILVTAYADVETAVGAMRDGAFDFLEKPLCQQKLLDSVFAALDLDRRNHDAAVERRDIQVRLDNLTSREREVMGRIVKGHPNKVIAFDLGIAQSTVENHRARVMEKMEADSLAELVRMSFVVEWPEGLKRTND